MADNLLVLRPEPGLSATLAAAREMGLAAVGYPLFEVHSRPWDCPDMSEIDALLIGSANAIRHAGETLSALKNKPVFAVGETTAQIARVAGFEIAAIGSGGLQNVLDAITPPSRLLRIAGADHVPLSVPDGISIHKVIAYETKPRRLPEAIHQLADPGLTVLVHSSASAEQFAREINRLGLDKSEITLVVIGPRVAQAVGEGWKALHVSPQPNDRAMLEMAKNVCI